MTTFDDATTARYSTASLPPEASVYERLPPIPALTVLAHPRLERIGDRVLLGELAGGREFRLARGAPRFRAPGATRGEPLADPFLSRRPILFETAEGGGVRLRHEPGRVEVAVDGEPVGGDHTVDGQALERGAVIELSRRVALLLHTHPPDDAAPGEQYGMVGASAVLVEARSAIARLAAFDVPVLVRGESGTGKELAARALHEHGARREGPFVSVNLAALTPSLAAAELFGVEKGAYTGATGTRGGYFERAHGGTLFLDEIGEAPAEIQAMLLRVLETGEVFRTGSQSPRRVDVRVLSATDADLEELAGRGGFRGPLLHRLAGYTLRLPPLRERRDDLGRLLLHFLRVELERGGERLPEGSEPWLPSALARRLALYDWPGNVRQLANVARQLVIDGQGRPSLSSSPEIDRLLGDPARPPEISRPEAPSPRPPRPARRKPSRISEDELLAALRENRFNLKESARALGIPRTSLYPLLKRSSRVRIAADVPADEIRSSWERYGGDLDEMVVELEISERALRQRLRDLGLR